jgi:predicted enzyme related to lactoylglutathione lyase
MDEKGNLKGPGVNGGLYKREQPQQQALNYVYVESVDQYSKKLETLGGQILISKTEIPEWAGLR